MDQPIQPYRGQAPVEQGETLVILDRNRGTERLRVSRETFNGFEFVRIQAWQINGQGQWWPAKGRCVTIKLRECGAIARALAAVARDQVEHRSPGRGSSTWGGRSPQRALPSPQPGKFDELDDG
jgi:hypothetical protein